MDFEAGEREYLLDMRMLTTDVHGREVIVGLDPEESEFYVAFSRDPDSLRQPGEPWQARDDRSTRYQELYWKMKRAQMDVVAAEHVVCTMSPTKN